MPVGLSLPPAPADTEVRRRQTATAVLPLLPDTGLGPAQVSTAGGRRNGKPPMRKCTWCKGKGKVSVPHPKEKGKVITVRCTWCGGLGKISKE